MYNQIVQIITDAVFGSGAVLEASQEFVITQIATYMSLGVVLLPFIVVCIIVAKLLKV